MSMPIIKPKDITYCSNEHCPRLDCERHTKDKIFDGRFSMSDFRVPMLFDNCEWYRKDESYEK